MGEKFCKRHKVSCEGGIYQYHRLVPTQQHAVQFPLRWPARSSRDSSDGQHERHSSASSQIMCKSWNWGHCVAPSASCHFAHKCSSCHGPHQAAVCPDDTPSKPSSSSKCSPNSPPPRSSRIPSCVDAPLPTVLFIAGSRRARNLVCTPYLDFGGNLFCQNRSIIPCKPIRSHFHSNKVF